MIIVVKIVVKVVLICVLILVIEEVCLICFFEKFLEIKDIYVLYFFFVFIFVIKWKR